MLQMRVYSERTVDKDGIITRTGEDAFPYINKAGMFVADGMGGGAGVAIVGFHPDCFDEERLIAKLSQIMKTPEPTCMNEFSDYIKQNFSSLTDPVIYQLYQNPRENTLRLKKSGYVGSHALGVVMTSWLILEEWQKRTMEEWENDIRDGTKKLFDLYKLVIDLLGSECAKVNFGKIDYYGTTLSAAFFRENTDSIDVIFLNCGDSRSYVWDQKGFRQACEDQGRRGGMTSRFSLGKDVDSRVSLEMKNYKKPCSVICMTDGVYNVFGGQDGFHSTPLYMEGVLMKTLGTASSMDEAQQQLKSVFDAKGQIDDSNSMVMASFGYETYQELKEAANQRMEHLNMTYSLRTQPDNFLVEDYKKKVCMLQQEYVDQMMPLLDKAYGLATIQEYCRSRIMQPAFRDKYCSEFKRIQSEIEYIHQANSEIENALDKIIEENFLDFVDLNSIGRFPLRVAGIFSSAAPDRARDWGVAYCSDFKKRAAKILKFIQCLQNTHDSISCDSESVQFDIGVVWSGDIEHDSIEWVKKTEKQIRDMSEILNGILHDIAELSKAISKDKTQWQAENSKVMSNYYNKGGKFSSHDLISSWVSNKHTEEIPILTTIPSVRVEIIDLLKRYHENVEPMGKLESDLMNAEEQAAYNYWRENAIHDISFLLKDAICFCNDQDLEKQIREKMDKIEDLIYYQQLYNEQKNVFDHYLEEHLSEVSAEKREDVKKYGWM